MRIILDTNLFISTLVTPAGLPAQIVDAWLADEFDLICSEDQIAEIRRVSRYDHIRPRVIPSQVGEFVNLLRDYTVMVTPILGIDASPDPDDNFLLGMAQAGVADYLVSGDKRDVIALGRWQHTQIVNARQMADVLKL